MLLLLKALVLGIVEGLTEFLPVSSTGHLIIAGALLDYPEAQRATFEIFIQLGSMCAVFWHFRERLLDLARRASHDAVARDLLLKVLVAFLPAAVGFLLHHWIEDYLFRVETVAAALIAGGMVILVVERQWYLPALLVSVAFERWIESRLFDASTITAAAIILALLIVLVAALQRRPLLPSVTALEQTRWRDAIIVGIAQVASLFPGVSRAAATIIGGMLVGLSRPVATEFSFYLALPTLSAASLYSLLKALPSLHAADAAPLAVGFAAAFAAALVVIRSFIVYVQSHDFRVFGYYRIAVGILIYFVARF